MEIVEFGALTDGVRQELEGEEDDPFDAGALTLKFRPKDRHVALREQGRVIASTGLVLAEVKVASAWFSVVGIGGVIVNEHHRGRGLGRAVVSAALRRAEVLGPPFALLFCREGRVGLYRKLGFETVDEDVLVEQPDGWATMPLCTMWRPLRAGAVWPPGPVSLHSLPF